MYHQHMGPESVFPGELLVAHTTVVVFLEVDNCLVSVERRRLSILLATDTTNVLGL